MFDMGVDPNQQQSGPGGFHFNSSNFEDIFSQFGFGFNRQRPRRNSTVSISVSLTLLDVLTGKELDAELAMPGGKKKLININIPAGVEHGQQIKYAGMGDNSIPGLAPGDLIVIVQVVPHPYFKRDHANLIFDKKISVWEALLGSRVEVNTLEGKTLSIIIPPGTQPDTVLSCQGEGLPNMRMRQRGSLLIKIKIDIPKTLTDEQRKLIEKIKNNEL
jgi:DnaJ-class molecular chaperone